MGNTQPLVIELVKKMNRIANAYELVKVLTKVKKATVINTNRMHPNKQINRLVNTF